MALFLSEISQKNEEKKCIVAFSAYFSKEDLCTGSGGGGIGNSCGWIETSPFL